MRSRKRRPQQTLEPPVEYQASENWNQEAETRIPSRLIDSATLRLDSVLAALEPQRQLWQMIDELPQDKNEIFHLVYEAETEAMSEADPLVDADSLAFVGEWMGAMQASWGMIFTMPCFVL